MLRKKNNTRKNEITTCKVVDIISKMRILLTSLIACIVCVPSAFSQPAVNIETAHLINEKKLTWTGTSENDIGKIIEKSNEKIDHKSFNEDKLFDLSTKLTEEVRAAGYILGQVLISKDDYEIYRENGLIKLTVFPGNVGEIVVNNSSKVNTVWIKSSAEKILCPDGVGDRCALRKVNLERLTQLLQDAAGLQLGVVEFSPYGVGVGQTKVTINAIEKEFKYRGAIGFDNHGSVSSGQYHLGATIASENMIGIGDSYTLNSSLSSKDNVAGGIDIVIPVGLNGLRMQSSIARSQLVLPGSSGTSTTGVSNSASLGLAYPWIRGLDLNLSSTINALGAFSEYGQSEVTISKKTIYAVQFSMSANSGDRALLLDADTWNVQTTLTMGQVSDAAAIIPTSAKYSKLVFQALKKKTLSADQGIYALVNMRGQWANSNLDAYEKFLLTGVNGARAYSPDQGTVDQGFIASIDVRKDINTAWGRMTPGVFFDYANGFINKNTYENWQINSGYSNSAQSNNFTLSNYGLSLNITGFKNSWLSATWARQMNASPAMLSNDSSANSQFWVSLRTKY